jgi:hypothetical protein
MAHFVPAALCYSQSVLEEVPNILHDNRAQNRYFLLKTAMGDRCKLKYLGTL